jgi:hypothetical protein
MDVYIFYIEYETLLAEKSLKVDLCYMVLY